MPLLFFNIFFLSTLKVLNRFAFFNTDWLIYYAFVVIFIEVVVSKDYLSPCLLFLTFSVGNNFTILRDVLTWNCRLFSWAMSGHLYDVSEIMKIVYRAKCFTFLIVKKFQIWHLGHFVVVNMLILKET